MLQLSKRNGRYRFSIFRHPVARVLKFASISSYLEQISPSGIVLDYGAGDQPYRAWLEENFSHYIACDFSVTNERHSAKPDFFVTGCGVGLDSETVDCVFLTEVLEHIFHPLDTLLEIRRLLRPGGYLVGSVPFAIGEHEPPYDFYRYTSYGIRALATDADFEVYDVSYIGDMVGVAASTLSRIGQLLPRGLQRLHLAKVAPLARLAVRLPELLYFAALQTPLSPQEVEYLKAYPLGFTFLLRKSPGVSPSTPCAG